MAHGDSSRPRAPPTPRAPRRRLSPRVSAHGRAAAPGGDRRARAPAERGRRRRRWGPSSGQRRRPATGVCRHHRPRLFPRWRLCSQLHLCLFNPRPRAEPLLSPIPDAACAHLNWQIITANRTAAQPLLRLPINSRSQRVPKHPCGTALHRRLQPLSRLQPQACPCTPKPCCRVLPAAPAPGHPGGVVASGSGWHRHDSPRLRKDRGHPSPQ